jgi:hypothetical protein
MQGKITRTSYAAAQALARAYVALPDRVYALTLIAWCISFGQLPKPRYRGIGSAEQIEAAIADALYVPEIDSVKQDGYTMDN